MTDNAKIRVAIVFGGQSAEDEISIPSARNVLETLDRSRFTALVTRLIDLALQRAPRKRRIRRSNPR